jgi:hypothetical protein
MWLSCPWIQSYVFLSNPQLPTGVSHDLYFANRLGFLIGIYILIVHVVKEDGTPAKPLELGRIVAKLPTPPGFMQTLYKAEDRFKLEYFGKYEVKSKILDN